MEVKDFRIGNLIADSETNEGFFEVEEIKKNSQGNLAIFFRNGSCMDLEPEPIPLTEEWLLKFGFKQSKMQTFEFFKDDVQIDHYANGGFGLKVRTINQNAYNPILFVHSLQNLFFALTGEELTIK